ncbi:hypothetical protein N9C31_02975 [Gammaproteobacteria bacterium]|nr:hypothetical protein [Gammaproteobacteria bacterium]
MRRYLESWLIFLKSDLQLSDMLKESRLSLCRALQNEHWDFPDEFIQALERNDKIFKIELSDTLQIASIKKVLNALENAQQGLTEVEGIDFSSERYAAGIINSVVKTLYSNMDQIFHAVDELNHLSPVIKSLFSKEISILYQVCSIFMSHLYDNRHQFHFDTASVHKIGKVIKEKKVLSTKSPSDIVIATVQEVGQLFNSALYVLQNERDAVKEDSYHLTEEKMAHTLQHLDERFKKGEIDHDFVINIQCMLSILKLSVQSINLVHESNELARNQLKMHLESLRTSILPSFFAMITEYEVKLQLKEGILSQQVTPHIKRIDSVMAKITAQLQLTELRMDSIAKKSGVRVATQLLTGETLRPVNSQAKITMTIPETYESDLAFQINSLNELKVLSQDASDKTALSATIADQCEEFFKLVDKVAQDPGQYAGSLASARPEDKIRMFQLLGSAQTGIVNKISEGFFNTVYYQLTPSLMDITHYLLHLEIKDEDIDQLSQVSDESRSLEGPIYQDNPFLRQLLCSDLYSIEQISNLPALIQSQKEASIPLKGLSWIWGQAVVLKNHSLPYIDTASSLLGYQKKILSPLQQTYRTHQHRRDRLNHSYVEQHNQSQISLDKETLSSHLRLEIQRVELTSIKHFIQEYDRLGEKPPLDSYPKQLHELLGLDVAKIKERRDHLSTDNKHIQIKHKHDHKEKLKNGVPRIEDSATLIENSLLTELGQLKLSDKLASTTTHLKDRLRAILREDIAPVLDQSFPDLQSLFAIGPTQQLYASLFFHLNIIESGLKDLECLDQHESSRDFASRTTFTLSLLVSLFGKIQKSSAAIMSLKTHSSLNNLIQEVEVILKPYQRFLDLETTATFEGPDPLAEKVDMIKMWEEQQAFVALSKSTGKTVVKRTTHTKDIPEPEDGAPISYQNFLELTPQQKMKEVHRLSLQDQITLLTDLPTLINPKVTKTTHPALIQSGVDLAKLIADSPLKLITHTQSMKIFKDALGEFIKASINIPVHGFDAYKDRSNQLLASISHISDVSSIELGIKIDSETPFQGIVDQFETFEIDLARSTESLDLWREIYIKKSISQDKSRIQILEKMADELNPRKYTRSLDVINEQFMILEGLSDLGSKEQQQSFLTTYQQLQKWLFRIDPDFDIMYFVRELQEKKDFEAQKTNILKFKDTLTSHMRFQIQENTQGSIKHAQLLIAIEKVKARGICREEALNQSSIKALGDKIDADLSTKLPKGMYPVSEALAQGQLKSVKEQLKGQIESIFSCENSEKVYQEKLSESQAQYQTIIYEAKNIIGVQIELENLMTIFKNIEPKPKYIESLKISAEQIIEGKLQRFLSKEGEEQLKELKGSIEYIKYEAHMKIDEFKRNLSEPECQAMLGHIDKWKRLLDSDKDAQTILRELRGEIFNNAQTAGHQSPWVIRMVIWIGQMMRQLLKKSDNPSEKSKVISLGSELTAILEPRRPK